MDAEALRSVKNHRWLVAGSILCNRVIGLLGLCIRMYPLGFGVVTKVTPRRAKENQRVDVLTMDSDLNSARPGNKGVINRCYSQSAAQHELKGFGMSVFVTLAHKTQKTTSQLAAHTLVEPIQRPQTSPIPGPLY
ncbi:hypothetical protein EV361DRAFT_946239 [Lentinula raphanica]|nr:hypothetical protein EV361DRAFT_946239 [Lentinula raphanica]